MQILKKIIVKILIFEARLILAKYRPTIVAVTGSVGKTSTKDAIYVVLKHTDSFVRKSEKSLNTEIGLPLTVIGIPTAWRSPSGWLSNIWKGMRMILFRYDYPKTLVLEVGADHPGDISSVAKWLRPHVAVITRISMTPVHVEFFSSPEEVFEEKASLAESVRPDGTVVLFADEPKVLSIRDRLASQNVSIVTFGTADQSSVRGGSGTIIYENQKPVGMSFEIFVDGNNFSINLKGVIGQTYIYPLLAAAAVGRARGIPDDKIASFLGEYKAPPGRMNLIEGINDSTLVDDTYNSSPDAALTALETLRMITATGAKIAVLGDMMELGKYSGEEHRSVGRIAAKCASRLVTVGPRSRSGMAEGALSEGMLPENVSSFATSDEAAEYLKPFVKQGDIILVKGSQSVRMEKIVKSLMKNPDLSEKLLVRQEREWLRK